MTDSISDDAAVGTALRDTAIDNTVAYMIAQIRTVPVEYHVEMVRILAMELSELAHTLPMPFHLEFRVGDCGGAMTPLDRSTPSMQEIRKAIEWVDQHPSQMPFPHVDYETPLSKVTESPDVRLSETSTFPDTLKLIAETLQSEDAAMNTMLTERYGPQKSLPIMSKDAAEQVLNDFFMAAQKDLLVGESTTVDVSSLGPDAIAALEARVGGKIDPTEVRITKLPVDAVKDLQKGQAWASTGYAQLMQDILDVAGHRKTDAKVLPLNALSRVERDKMH